MQILRAVPLFTFAPFAVFAASLTRCGACEPNPTPGPAPSASAAQSGSTRAPIASSSASAARLPRPPQPRMPCRIIEGTGQARLENGTDAGVQLMVNAPMMSNWVDLGADGRFVAKDPHTGRETTFRGPGRARACVQLNEESWVASGGFDSSVGAGEAPGNEEWVVTPVGVVRYAASKLSVDVHARDARVVISSGDAFLWVPSDASAHGGEAGAPTKGDDGWMRADVGTFTLSTTGATQPLSLEGARAALTACSSLGKAAHDLSAVLLAGGADAGTVMSQVSTRRMARAACAVAGLRLGALPPSPALKPLNSELAEGNAGWNSLPETPTPPPAPPP